MTTKKEFVLWLGGGGDAPGMNNLLRSTTLNLGIRDSREISVLGIPNGFRGIIQGAVDKVRLLQAADVQHINDLGGCILGMKRDTFENARQIQEAIEFIRALEAHFGGTVIQIDAAGGDDTLRSLNKFAHALQEAGMRMDFVHLAKTIDKDVQPPEVRLCQPWPGHEIEVPSPTYGYATCCEHWGQILLSKYLDAKTAGGTWHFDQMMGRDAGWLVHGTIQFAVSLLMQHERNVPQFHFQPPLAFVPEMFRERDISLEELAEMCVSGIARRAEQEAFGVILISEGVIPRLNQASKDRILGKALAKLDPHGHAELEAFRLLPHLYDEVSERLSMRGLNVRLREGGRLGYDGRGLPPNEFDRAYTDAIGKYAAARAWNGERGCVSLFYDEEVRCFNFQQLIGADGRVQRTSLPARVAAEYWRPITGTNLPPWDRES